MIRTSLAAAVRDALVALGIDPPTEIELERPARREHGDWSCNVALATARALNRAPRKLASELVEQLKRSPPAHLAAVEVAGPGFVNFRLHDSWLHDMLTDVIEGGEDGYARLDEGQR